MLGRVVLIFFLFVRLFFWYCLVIVTPKKRRSILLIPSFTEYGGTRTYFFYLIEYLFKKNYLVTVMLTKSQCDEEVQALQAQYPFIIQPLKFDVIRTKFEGTVFYQKNQDYLIYHLKELIYFWKQIVKLKASHLVISASNPEVLLSLMLSPLRVTYIIHTITMNWMDNLKKRLLNFSFSKRKQIITVSKSAREHILKNWTSSRNSSHIKVVYNFYQPLTQSVQHHSSSIKKVLTVGSVVYYKNPFLWRDVCKEVLLQYPGHAVEFIWAGDGELLADCRQMVKDIPQIKFIGYQKNIEQLYADCTIYFQPSIFESHGIAALGAMYFQKPCVVSNKQGLPESVIENETGLVVAVEQPHAAAMAILALLNDNEKAVEFGKAGKERVNTYFVKSKWYSDMDRLITSSAR